MLFANTLCDFHKPSATVAVFAKLAQSFVEPHLQSEQASTCLVTAASLPLSPSTSATATAAAAAH